MRDWPRGYTVWSEYYDEDPEDLHNRLMAEQVNTVDEARQEFAERLDLIADEARQELAERLERIADALESIVGLFGSRIDDLGREIINIKQNNEGSNQ